MKVCAGVYMFSLFPLYIVFMSALVCVCVNATLYTY